MTKILVVDLKIQRSRGRHTSMNCSSMGLGVSVAPESLSFMKESEGTGTINVGKTSWIGGPYQIPNNGASDRYMHQMDYNGGY